jgi:hypothetical protein
MAGLVSDPLTPPQIRLSLKASSTAGDWPVLQGGFRLNLGQTSRCRPAGQEFFDGIGLERTCEKVPLAAIAVCALEL